EVVEDGFSQFLHPAGMCLCRLGHVVRIQSRIRAQQLVAVTGRGKPATDQRRIHFQMELETVGGLAVPECLIFATASARKMLRGLRDREGVAVPLEYR